MIKNTKKNDVIIKTCVYPSLCIFDLSTTREIFSISTFIRMEYIVSIRVSLSGPRSPFPRK